MPETDPVNALHWLHVVWGTLSGIVVWNGRQLFKRLDILEGTKADEDKVNERREENKENFKEIIESLKDLTSVVHKISLEVNTLMERSRAAIAKEKH